MGYETESNKEKLIDTDRCMVVARGYGVRGRRARVTGVKHAVTEGDLTLSGERTM